MDQILSWTKNERLGHADLLETLDDDQWTAATLCPEWTVHELAAHLTTSTGETFLGTLKGVIRARGDWNRMNADRARELAAAFSQAELIAQLRETAGSAHRAPGASPLDPLTDMLVHGQDFARPLGLSRKMPLEPAIAALGHVVKSRFYGARKRFRGVRLVATDAEWTSGTGPDEIRGPVEDLLLLATGRPTGLAQMAGSGVERLAAAG